MFVGISNPSYEGTLTTANIHHHCPIFYEILTDPDNIVTQFCITTNGGVYVFVKMFCEVGETEFF